MTIAIQRYVLGFLTLVMMAAVLMNVWIAFQQSHIRWTVSASYTYGDQDINASVLMPPRPEQMAARPLPLPRPMRKPVADGIGIKIK